MNHFKFKQRVWRSSGKGGWYFITLSQKRSREIRLLFQDEEQGWGRLKVSVSMNNTKWSTSIWYDSKLSRYLLPINSNIRKAESIIENSLIQGIVRIKS